MTDKTKKGLNIASAIAIAVGVVGYVLTGGDEAGALNIVTVGVAAVGGVIALIDALRK